VRSPLTGHERPPAPATLVLGSQVSQSRTVTERVNTIDQKRRHLKLSSAQRPPLGDASWTARERGPPLAHGRFTLPHSLPDGGMRVELPFGEERRLRGCVGAGHSRPSPSIRHTVAAYPASSTPRCMLASTCWASRAMQTRASSLNGGHAC